MVKAAYQPQVTADPIVLIMACQFGFQQRPPFLHRAGVPHSLEPVVQLLAFLAKLLSAGLASDDELPLPTAVAVVGETQEVKRIGPSLLPLGGSSLISPKTDDASFLRV